MEIEDKKKVKLTLTGNLKHPPTQNCPKVKFEFLEDNEMGISRLKDCITKNKSGESLSVNNIGQAVVAELASGACYLFLNGQEFEACCSALIYN